MVFMALGSGRRLPHGLAGGKQVVSARGSRPAQRVVAVQGGSGASAALAPASEAMSPFPERVFGSPGELERADLEQTRPIYDSEGQILAKIALI